MDAFLKGILTVAVPAIMVAMVSIAGDLSRIADLLRAAQ